MNRVAAQCNIATALKDAAANSLPFISTTRVCAKFKEVLKLTSASMCNNVQWSGADYCG